MWRQWWLEVIELVKDQQKDSLMTNILMRLYTARNRQSSIGHEQVEKNHWSHSQRPTRAWDLVNEGINKWIAKKCSSCVSGVLESQLISHFVYFHICTRLGHPTSSEADNSRDAFDEVHFCLVADAGQICVHWLTFITSCCLIHFGCRSVEAVAVVIMPAAGTDWTA